MRLRLTLEYDGTDFRGWAAQPGLRTVEGVLREALDAVYPEWSRLAVAGRTDAGVHALGQVAAFALARDIDGETVTRALNARLPDAVRVLSAAHAPESFHPRFDARAKTYRYRLCVAPVLSPFDRRYAWHVPGSLDVDAMRAAACRVEGRHDFAAFQSAGSDVATTERAISLSRLDDCGQRGIVAYEIRGDGFLRHMVRSIVGTLVEVGRGRRPPAWIDEVIASRDRSAAGPTAPAAGLFLVSVDYGLP
jgi:tRNA pseudouridine38-40 synthase